jgi:hypothetical protein
MVTTRKPKPALKRQINIRIAEDLADDVEKQAEREQRTVSDMARILLLRGLQSKASP